MAAIGSRVLGCARRASLTPFVASRSSIIASTAIASPAHSHYSSLASSSRCKHGAGCRCGHNARCACSVCSGQQIRSFSSGHKEPIPVQTPGAPDGTMPDFHNQAVGKEYEEIEAADQGFDRFADGPLVGPFGTQDHPAEVLSEYDVRIVGCVGGGGHPKHDLVWFELKHGLKHICRECGQFFKLVTELSNPEEQNKFSTAHGGSQQHHGGSGKQHAAAAH